ncbi:MAG: endonuclease/exonuclease/phosphatase family protein [Candidatus Cryptobacteroides sp.]
MRKIYKYITIVSAVLAACSCNSGEDNSRATGAFDISITSFNVLGVDSKAEWAPRVKAIGDIVNLEGHCPDILCLQECSDTAKQSDLRRLFREKYDSHSIGLTDASPALILWDRQKFSKTDAGYSDMLLGDTGYGMSDYTGSRYAHYVRLMEKSTGCEFLVYNIHLKTNSSTVSYQKLRYDCITALCPAAIDRAERLGGIPVFIMGDFNNYIDTEEAGCISAPSACIAGGFTESASTASECINLDYKTSGVDMSGKATPKPDGNYRIDYIFYRYAGPVSVSRYQTVIDFVNGSAEEISTPVASDHHPVNAIFHLEYR